VKLTGIVLHPSTEKQFERYLQSPTHAVLLTGDAGTGKTHIASELARELLQATSLDGQAYFRIVAPKNNAITIEQIRELINFFQLKVPGRGKIRRAAIIQDAERMGTEAQNALLKLLEEPPADSVLILTSSQPQSLLMTIRSRAQTLSLARPEQAVLRSHFMAAGHSEQRVHAALLRAGTNIAEAERLLSADDDADTTVALVKQVLGGTAYDRMLLVDGLSKQKDQAQVFTDTLATVAMASLHAAASRGASTVDRWKNILAASTVAQQAFDKNGNAKIILTELMLAI
jgi:DNA polymerase III delta prime subunit